MSQPYATTIATRAISEEEMTFMNPKDNPNIKWCIDNKAAILDLHSSLVYTSVFELYCEGCSRYYKHCMFSKSSRKSDWGPSCRWCQLDKGQTTEAQEFSIYHHIHCNRGGKKECGLGTMSLIRPAPKVEEVIQVGIESVPAPEVVFVFKGKGGQKERKRLENEAREARERGE